MEQSGVSRLPVDGERWGGRFSCGLLQQGPAPLADLLCLFLPPQNSTPKNVNP